MMTDPSGVTLFPAKNPRPGPDPGGGAHLTPLLIDGPPPAAVAAAAAAAAAVAVAAAAAAAAAAADADAAAVGGGGCHSSINPVLNLDERSCSNNIYPPRQNTGRISLFPTFFSVDLSIFLFFLNQYPF